MGLAYLCGPPMQRVVRGWSLIEVAVQLSAEMLVRLTEKLLQHRDRQAINRPTERRPTDRQLD